MDGEQVQRSTSQLALGAPPRPATWHADQHGQDSSQPASQSLQIRILLFLGGLGGGLALLVVSRR